MTDDSENRDVRKEAFATMNQGNLDANSLQIRLLTHDLLNDIEMQLKGIREKLIEKDGELVNIVISKGRPLVNDYGVQSIMSYLSIILSPSIVQGNFTDQRDYEQYMMQTRKEFACNLSANQKRFELSTNDFNGLVSLIFAGVYMFISRAINNEERKGFSQGVKVIESNTIKEGKKTTNWLPF